MKQEFLKYSNQCFIETICSIIEGTFFFCLSAPKTLKVASAPEETPNNKIELCKAFLEIRLRNYRNKLVKDKHDK